MYMSKHSSQTILALCNSHLVNSHLLKVSVATFQPIINQNSEVLCILKDIGYVSSVVLTEVEDISYASMCHALRPQ